MALSIITVLIGLSVGLGVALKKRVTGLHIVMCVLISFLFLLILFVVIAETIGMVRPASIFSKVRSIPADTSGIS